MTSLLSSHLEDCSTAQYFCFSVRCEVCGEYWYSSSIPFSKAAQAAQHLEKKELYDAIYQREKERAKSAAGSSCHTAIPPRMGTAWNWVSLSRSRGCCMSVFSRFQTEREMGRVPGEDRTVRPFSSSSVRLMGADANRR